MFRKTRRLFFVRLVDQISVRLKYGDLVAHPVGSRKGSTVKASWLDTYAVEIAWVTADPQ